MTVTTIETGAPMRTRDQRLDALREANRIRTYRKNVKADIAAGRRTVAAVIADPEEELASMKLIELLLATPKVGRVRINNLFRSLDVSPSKTVGGLTERQRDGLAAAINGNHVPLCRYWAVRRG